MKVLACTLGLALVAGAAVASSPQVNATSSTALENIMNGQMEAAISSIVPGFEWQWLQRNPQVSRRVEDPTLDWVFGDFYSHTSSEEQRSFIEFAAWKNSLVVAPVIEKALPHFFVSWVRNYILGMLLYMTVGGLWCLTIYGFCRTAAFGDDEIPTTFAILEQIKVSTNAMLLYTWLPTWSEWLVERGFSLSYDKLETVSPLQYVAYLGLYMLGVEFGIYWMHRSLHDIKPLYRLLHSVHHKYNKNNTLSPFAGLAFHPVDGCLQAVPYVVMMFVVPMHFLTHEVLLFCTAIWTTNIHDTLQGNTEPAMGAKYHEIHHTDYKHNYGQYSILFDWVFGTLKVPEGSSWGAWESTGGEGKSAGRTKWDKDQPALEGNKPKKTQ